MARHTIPQSRIIIFIVLLAITIGGSGDETRSDIGALSDALFPTEAEENTLPGDRSALALHQDIYASRRETTAVSMACVADRPTSE